VPVEGDVGDVEESAHVCSPIDWGVAPIPRPAARGTSVWRYPAGDTGMMLARERCRVTTGSTFGRCGPGVWDGGFVCGGAGAGAGGRRQSDLAIYKHSLILIGCTRLTSSGILSAGASSSCS